MKQRTKRFLSYVLSAALALGIWSSQSFFAEAKEEVRKQKEVSNQRVFIPAMHLEEE